MRYYDTTAEHLCKYISIVFPDEKHPLCELLELTLIQSNVNETFVV